jgi:CxxC motif-containing protein
MKPDKSVKEMVCIVCPVGCRLKVTVRGEEVSVSGNRCPRGEVYGREEILAPKRVVTATCALRSAAHPRVPVGTDGPLPSELIDDLLKEIYRLSVSPPVAMGDVLIENFRGTGVNVKVNRSFPD